MDYIKYTNRNQIEMYNLDDQIEKENTIRFCTVEPVLGTLLIFLNLKRVNTRGIKQANKHVMMEQKKSDSCNRFYRRKKIKRGNEIF